MATLFAAVTMAAFVLSCAACGLIRRFAPVIGLVDKPGERKIHHTAMPTGGGLGIWLSVILLALFGTVLAGLITRAVPSDASGPVTLWGITLPELITRRAPGVLFQARRFWVLLGLGTILVALGTIDDRRGLSWKLRLGVQTLVAVAAVAAGWEATFFLPIPWLTKILSVLWIVGLINSFNMLDNMDALSGGVAVICSSFLAAVLLLFARNAESGEPQLFLGGFLLLLAGAILGFLVHNRPPARLFMGDGGAYFIGFLLAVMTLSATFVGEQTPKQAILVPLCILAVPLYDTTSVVIIRLRNGRSPFVGDNNHYSHRLVALGLSKPAAVATIYLTTASCAAGALFLYQVSTALAIWVVLQVLMILSLVGILEFTARKTLKKQ